MATCAVAVLQSDGSYNLKLEPSIVDTSTCAYVVASGTDINPFSMSASDGFLVSSAIIGCWFTGFVVKSIKDVIRGNSNE